MEEQVVHQWTVLEGDVTDGGGRPMSGSRVRIGLGVVNADDRGHYRIEIRPGLYDMSLGRAPGQVAGGVLESVPLWSSRNNSQNLLIQPASQKFLPIIRR